MHGSEISCAGEVISPWEQKGLCYVVIINNCQQLALSETDIYFQCQT